MVFAIPSLQHLQTINSITQSTVAHVFYLDQNVRHLFLELHLAWILALGNCNWKPRPGSWFGTCNLDIATWNPDDLHLGLKLENCNLQLQTLTWILVWNLTHTHTSGSIAAYNLTHTSGTTTSMVQKALQGTFLTQLNPLTPQTMCELNWDGFSDPGYYQWRRSMRRHHHANAPQAADAELYDNPHYKCWSSQ